MQVSVEAINTFGNNLGRKLTVVVPEANIKTKTATKLKELSKTIKLDGFRKGKVPPEVINQRFGKSIRDEVVGDEINHTLFAALTQEKQNPAGTPVIESIKAEQGQPLEYVATYEVYPVIELADFNNIKVDKVAVNITEQDIDKVVENIRKQHVQWEKVDRAAVAEDKVSIDFEGMMDGKPFDGGKAENVPLVIGSKQFIPGFEEGLIGLKAGEEKNLELTFPENYNNKVEFSNKPATFHVKVKSVEAPKLPEINAEFAKKMGIEDETIEGFRTKVKEHMQRELEGVLRNRQKKQVFDELVDQNKFDVPKALVEREGQALLHMYEHGDTHDHHEGHDHGPLPDAVRAEAARRVSIGLVVAEIIKQNEIKVNQEKVREHIEKMASAYQQPKQLISYYYSNKERLASIEAIVLEDQVLDKILEKATVNEKTSTYDEVIKA